MEPIIGTKEDKKNRKSITLTQEEITTLEEVAKHHPYVDYRPRALGLLALNDGKSIIEAAELLHVTRQTIHNWITNWRVKGLVGLLNGHRGGRGTKLSPELLDVLAEIADAELLSLQQIAQRFKEHCPYAPEVSLDTLRRALIQRDFSYQYSKTLPQTVGWRRG